MARDRDDRDERPADEDDRPRRRPRDDRDDYEEDRRPPRTTMPGASRAAGIIWITTGAIAAILTLGAAYQLVLAIQFIGVEPVSICSALFLLTLTLFGLIAGIKTVVGTSSEPIANGVVSLLFAALFLGVAALVFIAGSGALGGRFARGDGALAMLLSIVPLVYGLLLLTAGILVLVGRGEYVRYRQYRKGQRSPARDRYEDEDDRPRRRPRRDDEE